MRPASYIWSDEARSLEVELALAVVQQLSLNAFEAYKSLPHRGLEIGGLLLGSVRTEDGRTIVSIDNFAEVASEHRSGPSYQLSPADLEVLDYTRSTYPQAVGMYRTSTQAQNLTLYEDDSALFQRHFHEPDAIYLLVHPATRRAAFCLAEGGVLTIAHEFPFHAANLQAAPLEAPSPAPAATTPSVVTAPVSRGRAWAARAAALCVGALLGAFTWRWLAPPLAQTATAPAAHVSTVAAPPPSAPDHVALDVKRDGRVLSLTWDREAPAIRTADRAVLHILDGTHQTNLNLTSGELSSGLLSYWAETPDVTFRLETFGVGHQTDDSVRAVGAAPFSPPVVADLPNKPAPQHSWKPASDAPSPDDAAADSASRSTPEASHASPFMPPPKPAPAPMEAIAAPAPVPSTPPPSAPPARSTEPRVEVSADPVTASRLTRAVHHIPLLRRLKKDQEATVPPTALHEVKPPFSQAQRRALDSEVPVDVHVYITDAGKVDYAELVDTHTTDKHRDLADAAVFAARRWSFHPARTGDQNVPSEAILHFRFKVEEPPQP